MVREVLIIVDELVHPSLAHPEDGNDLVHRDDWR